MKKFIRFTKSGFSLLELLVTIAMVAALFSIAMPSYDDFIKRYKIKAEVNKWLLALNFARQTAITSGNIITLCPSSNKLSCGASWREGAIVFVDLNKNHIKDPNEILLHTFDSSFANQQVSWRAFQNRNYLQFQQNGFTWAQNGTFRICVAASTLQYNRALIVTRSGRIRLSTDVNGDGFHQDSKGAKISC